MSKGLFASEDVMKEYLTSLLTEEETTKLEPKARMEPVARLLETVPEPVKPVAKPQPPKPVVEKQPEAKIEVVEAPIVKVAPPPPTPPVVNKQKSYRKGSFQALLFKVAGLTVAVPLQELGGIHNLTKLNSLFGKPNWFMGVMVSREEKLNVVDTAKWVMPEKINEKLEESINYQYLIMLGESKWGLACESLVNTVTLEQEDVRWRENQGKRPWLAGLVKEKMCAMMDVDNLIELLDQGLNSKDVE